MKKSEQHKTAKRSPLMVLLFLLIALFSLSYQTFAQGWTFSARIQETGPCYTAGAASTVAEANAAFASAGNLGIPTQSQCQAIRAMAAISVSTGPLYDANGNYIGTCTVSIVCGPCTGSDINSGLNPGDVNFNAAAQGLPYCTDHPSDLVQQLIDQTQLRLNSQFGINGITKDPKYDVYGEDAAYSAQINKLVETDFNPVVHTDQNDHFTVNSSIPTLTNLPKDKQPPLSDDNRKLMLIVLGVTASVLTDGLASPLMASELGIGASSTIGLAGGELRAAIADEYIGYVLKEKVGESAEMAYKYGKPPVEVVNLFSKPEPDPKKASTWNAKP